MMTVNTGLMEVRTACFFLWQGEAVINGTRRLYLNLEPRRACACARRLACLRHTRKTDSPFINESQEEWHTVGNRPNCVTIRHNFLAYRCPLRSRRGTRRLPLARALGQPVCSKRSRVTTCFGLSSVQERKRLICLASCCPTSCCPMNCRSMTTCLETNRPLM